MSFSHATALTALKFADVVGTVNTVHFTLLPIIIDSKGDWKVLKTLIINLCFSTHLVSE